MQKISPYLRLMRLHQPVGIWLVYWPCVWAILLSSQLNVALMAIFLLGAVITRSAGCIVNDMADRNFDKHVARTKHRPLASGELSMMQASALLALLCMLSLAILAWAALHLPARTNWVHLLAITLPAAVLIVAYPFMKRITWWPQAFLGLTFNWGVFIAWFVSTGNVSAATYCLYAACFFWTLGYDTIYGHQDKNDDQKIGIKSTSLRLGNRSKLWIGSFYAAMIVLFLLAASLTNQPLLHGMLPYYVAIIMAIALFLQIKCVNLDDPSSCMSAFKSNAWLGLPYLAMAMAWSAYLYFFH
jgi:4-hydroxybenzoate polyprenyltransferase